MTDDDFWGALVIGGLGYLLGQGQYEGWKPLIQQYQNRLYHLQYSKSPYPFGFLNGNNNMKIVYREGVLSYLLGLSNSAIPNLIRVLEQALISKYESTEKKKPDNVGLSDLIDWAEKMMKEKTNIAHSFRMLRNFLHTDKLVLEQDCLECIRHVSIIINNLFPTDFVTVNTHCRCGATGIGVVLPESRFLATNLSFQCNICHQTFNWVLLP